MALTMRDFVNGLAALLTAPVIAIVADVFRTFGVSLYTEQYLAALLALATPSSSCTFRSRADAQPAKAPFPGMTSSQPRSGFLCSVYLFFQFPDLSQQIAAQPLLGLVVAGILILLFLEGLRRTTGLILTVVTAAFFILALIGGLLPGDLAAKSIPFPRLTYYVVWDSSALFGLPLKIISTVVVIYTFFGAALVQVGRLDLLHRLRHGADGTLPRRPGQDRDPGLVAVRHHLRQHRLQRADRRRGHDPADEARRLPAAPRRRHRGLRLHRRPIDAAGDGHRRLRHGRVPAGALRRRRARRGHPGHCSIISPSSSRSTSRPARSNIAPMDPRSCRSCRACSRRAGTSRSRSSS